MIQDVTVILSPRDVASDLTVRAAASTKTGIDINRIKKIDIIKKSIDARQRDIKVNITLRVHIDEIDNSETANPYLNIRFDKVSDDAPSVIIVGAGPAGLFAALQLIEEGVRPVILERGKDVDSRRKDLAAIARQGIVDADSNYCFGEGGAGTFSDGKLFTRSKKKGPVEKILALLHNHGAPENILYEAHPHIGTDLLPGIIKNIRNTILECGGEIHFNSRVTELLTVESDNGIEVEGVKTADGTRYNGPVILATGHSARDTFRMLYDKGVTLEPKGLAIGVRLEHQQDLIDRIQYHKKEGRGKFLPAAEYSLLTRVDGRGVYSFCMCPGGVVVPSASGPGQSAVNGMSASARGSRWANSAMVVEILPEDVPGNSPLRMLEYQEGVERRFFDEAGGTQKAPAQRMTDFVNGVVSKTLEPSSYAPGIFPAHVDRLLPVEISQRLKKGFVEFGRKKPGFLTPQATVIGAETRTSSPLRLPRDKETFEHIGVRNLYPAGEGAGWAGGIVSSALDGQNVAKALCRSLYSPV